MECNDMEIPLQPATVIDMSNMAAQGIDEAIQVTKPELNINDELEVEPLGQWITVVKKKKNTKKKPLVPAQKVAVAKRNQGKKKHNGKASNDGAIKIKDSTKKQHGITGNNHEESKSNNEGAKSNEERGVVTAKVKEKGIFHFGSTSGPTIHLPMINKKRRTRGFDWEQDQVNATHAGPLRILGRNDDVPKPVSAVTAVINGQLGDNVMGVDDGQEITNINTND